MTILLLFVAFFLGFTIGKLSKSDADAAKADAWRIEKAQMLLTIHTQADHLCRKHQRPRLRVRRSYIEGHGAVHEG